jgi:multidrug transporter EmrE-like cation transporter
MHYIYILITIILTVYGQIVVKWQVNLAGAFPASILEKTLFLAKLLINPWVISSMAAALLAGMTWMAAMTKLHLSYAYPFMGLTFILVLILSGVFFDEPMNWQKTAGVLLIIGGIALSSQG